MFKGSTEVDPNVHIQEFVQWTRLKGVDIDEYEDYFPTTQKEFAQKCFYHYPPKKLPTYNHIKREFLLSYMDEKIDEDVLCDLGRIGQKDTSVRKYVEKLKGLTRQLELQSQGIHYIKISYNTCE